MELHRLREKVEELEQRWEVFTRHMFLFMKSLQMTTTTVGGSPTYFQTVQDVLKYFDYTLAHPCSERETVQTWLDLREDTIRAFNDLVGQLTPSERPQFHDVISHMASLTAPTANLAHLARLNHFAMTELERRILGGIANLIPVLLEGLHELIYEVLFLRKDRLRQDMEIACGGVGHVDPQAIGRQRDQDPSYYSALKDLDDNVRVSRLQTQQLDRQAHYRENQRLQRGLPFSDWKMKYIDLGHPL